MLRNKKQQELLSQMPVYSYLRIMSNWESNHKILTKNIPKTPVTIQRKCRKENIKRLSRKFRNCAKNWLSRRDLLIKSFCSTIRILSAFQRKIKKLGINPMDFQNWLFFLLFRLSEILREL